MRHELAAFKQPALVLPPSNSEGRRPVIEFTHVAYRNVGDLLMLTAAEAALSRILPDAVFVRQLAGDTARRFPIRSAEHCGPRDTATASAGRWVRRSVGRVVPRAWKTKVRSGVPYDRVAALVDISGYTYFDHTYAPMARSDAQMFARAKALGKKVILMPKAFGPFDAQQSTSGQQLMDAVRVIVRLADLCFVRDPVSMGWIESLRIDLKNVVLAPDYTMQVKGRLRPEHERFRGRICVVPNHRLVERIPFSSPEIYVAFLADVLRDLRCVGLDPYILVHDYGADTSLVAPLRAGVGGLEVVQESDPLHIKGLIGTADMVIGSRTHGLINALSQGVPSIALGWTHKYETLMADYDVPEMLVQLPFENARRDIASLVARLTQPGDFRADVAGRIARSRARISSLNAKMWAQVEGVLTSV